MSDVETLEKRVETVERAVTDGDHAFPAVDELAELTDRVERLEADVAELHERADELDAATQALRGYVGNVRSVNERVEGRADAALAATERLERRLDAVTEDRRPADGDDGSQPQHDALDDQSPDGTVEGLAGVETNDAAERDSDRAGGSVGDSRDPGVLERARSLL